MTWSVRGGFGVIESQKMYLHSLPSESDRSGLLVHFVLTSLLAPDLRIKDVLQTIGQLLAQVSDNMVYVGVLGSASHAGTKLFAGILMSLAGILIIVNHRQLESSIAWLES